MKRIIARVAAVLALLFSLGATTQAAAAPPGPDAPRRPLGVTITVDTLNDSDTRDGELSLREAIRIANGDLKECFTEHEKNQISGAAFSPPLFFPLCELANLLDPPRYSFALVANVGYAYADDIAFSVSAGQIALGSALPKLNVDDDINGSASGGKITLNGGGLAGNGITIDTPGCLQCDRTTGNQIQNLIIRGFNGHGIATEDRTVALGMVLKGLEVHSNSGSAIYLTGSVNRSARNIQIGGASAGEGNLLYANGQTGITISNTGSPDAGLGVVIEGTYIGLKSPSDTSSSNGNGWFGVWLVDTYGARVGGDTAASRNWIANNGYDGIRIEGAAADGTTIFNNYLGLTAGGSVVRGNAWGGVTVIGGAASQVGAAGKGNVIVGNQVGVYISGSGADGNRIEGNAIGAFGASAMPNLIGIRILGGAKDTLVGGTAVNTSNYIGGNTSHGVMIEGSGTANTRILGNGIGNSVGLFPDFAQNGGDGIQILSPAASTIISANLISNNLGHGVVISGASATNNQLLSNFIGRSLIGLPPFQFAYENGGDGVRIQGGADNNDIGLPGQGNTISGNGGSGIDIRAAGSTGNRIFANVIGLTANLQEKRGNGASGVALLSGAGGNDVGGSRDLGRGNVIAGNAVFGIYVETSGNAIHGNYIGTTAASTSTLGNGNSGIYVSNGASNFIGYTLTLGYGNVIGGNGGPGIDLTGASASANRIYSNKIGNDLFGTLAIPNASGGIRLTGGAHDNIIGGGIANLANIISGNGGPGVGLYNAGTTANTVRGNTIGLQSTGNAILPNGTHGVVIQEGAALNVIDGNTISGNAGNGVWISDNGSADNEIARNTIGLNASGNARLANAANGVIIRAGAGDNFVGKAGQGNTISGNGLDGVLIDGVGTSGNFVLSNTIGLNLGGFAVISNAANGVRLAGGASVNYIGWDVVNAVANTISGNAGDGVKIEGSATNGNFVNGNVIGLNQAQTNRLGNAASGVSLLGGTRNNMIGFPIAGGMGGNVIAGNASSGVHLSDAGTASNLIHANFIGINRSSAQGLGNGWAGVALYNGAVTNTIGGDRPSGFGNVMAGNAGPGVDLANSGTRNNTISGNIIGANPATTLSIPNGIGIRLLGGTLSNTIGGSTAGRGNILSGNLSHGIGVYNTGTVSNVIASNLIGTNLSGTSALPNAQYGIVIQEAASSNVITGNLLSGNGSDGVNLNGAGTRLNLVLANKIGTNLAGTAAISNAGNGVAILAGASENRIGAITRAFEMNTISGNGLAGVLVGGMTSISNTLRANRIGAGLSGMNAIPNRGAGVSLQTTTATSVCGVSLGSVIAGNAGPGIWINGGRENRVDVLCQVGVAADGVTALGNGVSTRQAGISLTNTISNLIQASLIAHNGGAGIAVAGVSVANVMFSARIHSNGGIPIDLGDDGPTPNDPGDGDEGPNRLLNYPVVTTRVGNVITGTTCAGCFVDIFFAHASTALPGGSVEWNGWTQADGAGVFSAQLTDKIMNGGLRFALQAYQPSPGNGLGNSSELSPWWGTWIPLLRR